MNRRKMKAFAFLPLVIFAGCASAYDCYSCGRVNCGYCPPNAMSCSHSQNGNCSDTLGQEYIARAGMNRSAGLTSKAPSISSEKGVPTTESDANSGN